VRVAWATDIHLNFVEAAGRGEFFAQLRDSDAALISGDIGESPSVESYLREMAESFHKPVYFALGNHDFYRGSIAQTRARVGQTARESKDLVYLTQETVVELTPATALVGHDGWADARLGDYEGSQLIINDYLLIRELYHWKNGFSLDRAALRKSLEAMGDAAARHFETVLPEAAGKYPRVIALTHVPPFREAAWYNGELCDDHWLPHFSCRAVGDVLKKVMARYPACKLLVLCGHTHGRGEATIADNIRVLTGGARYKRPVVQRVFELE